MKRLWAIALLVAACGGTVDPGTTTATVTGSPPPTGSPLFDHPNDLPIGQCFNPIVDKDKERMLTARLKSCDEAHLAEIIGRVKLPYPVGIPYPGDELDARTEECQSVFRDYVGIEYDLSNIDLASIYPSPETWSDGDRLVTCYVFGTDVAPFTRSVKGTGAQKVGVLRRDPMTARSTIPSRLQS
jgi:hypothetical protein